MCIPLDNFLATFYEHVLHEHNSPMNQGYFSYEEYNALM